MTRLWGDEAGRATKTDRILVLGATEAGRRRALASARACRSTGPGRRRGCARSSAGSRWGCDGAWLPHASPRRGRGYDPSTMRPVTTAPVQRGRRTRRRPRRPRRGLRPGRSAARRSRSQARRSSPSANPPGSRTGSPTRPDVLSDADEEQTVAGDLERLRADTIQLFVGLRRHDRRRDRHRLRRRHRRDELARRQRRPAAGRGRRPLGRTVGGSTPLDGVTDDEIDAILVDAVEPNLQTATSSRRMVDGGDALADAAIAEAVTPPATAPPAGQPTTVPSGSQAGATVADRPHPGARGPPARRRHPPRRARVTGVGARGQGPRRPDVDQLNQRREPRAARRRTRRSRTRPTTSSSPPRSGATTRSPPIATRSPTPPASCGPPSRSDSGSTTPSQTRRPSKTRMLQEILAAHRTARTLLDEQEQRFDQLRDLEQAAPAQLEAIRPRHRAPGTRQQRPPPSSRPAGHGLCGVRHGIRRPAT